MGKRTMTDLLLDDGIDELSIIIIVTFCSAIRWLEMTQIMEILFDNGREINLFVGDKPQVRWLIERAAETRRLAIERY